MTNTLTITLCEVDGQPMMDAQAMALAFGVDVAAVQALPIVGGHMRLPREWVRRGKRRANEAMAQTSSDELIDVLGYWARRDYDADLQVVYQ